MQIQGQEAEQKDKVPVYTEPSVRTELSTIAKRLLADPPAEAYANIPSLLDEQKPQIDRLSYSGRLQVRRPRPGRRGSKCHEGVRIR
jgi:hypothetical protein